MIDINLVPEQSRKSSKSLLALSSKVPAEIIVGVAGGVIFLLVLAHVSLLGLNVLKIFQYKMLQQKIVKIKSEKEKVDKVINDMRLLQAKAKSIENITSGKAILWSEKLNIISDLIAKGVWLSKIELTDDVLLIQGKALSRKNEQMLNAHNFAATLKQNKRFLEKFKDLEVGSIQLQKVGETEIANFVITCNLKKDE